MMMKKRKCKLKKIISIIILSISMLTVSICGANAAEATANNEANDNNTSAVEEATDENNENNDVNNTDYNWSSNTSGNANLTADQEILMENGIYQFIAVNTRDGDIFYVIIDKTKTEDNVYFLNEVDTADIEKFLGDDTNSNNTAVQETTQPATQQAEKTSSSNDSQFLIYLAAGVFILGGICFAIFKLKKGKSPNKNSDVEDDFDDFDYEEVNEDDIAGNTEDNK